MNFRSPFAPLFVSFLLASACERLEPISQEGAGSAQLRETLVADCAEPTEFFETGLTTVTRLDLNAIWGSSAKDVWAVGYEYIGTFKSLILHFNGSNWQRYRSSGTSKLLGVWGTSASAAWAVGESGILLRWNGSNWSKVTGAAIPSTNLNDVWGTSASDVWVVGDDGVVLRWNGTAWSVVPTPSANHFQTVWGNTPNNVWVGGDLGSILYWDGTAFKETQSGTLAATPRIRGSSTGKVWKISDSNVLSTWNGTSWSDVLSTPMGSSVKGYNLWVNSDTSIWVLGSAYRAEFTQWNGTTWSPVSAETQAKALWTAGASDGWAVTDYNLLLRYNGTDWRSYR